MAWLKNSLAPSFLCVFLTASLTLPIQQATANPIVVSTLSGRGGGGVFQSPYGIGIAPDGTIYVADKGHFKIKKIVKGVISDFASIAPTSLVAIDESFCSISVKIISVKISNQSLWEIKITPST